MGSQFPDQDRTGACELGALRAPATGLPGKPPNACVVFVCVCFSLLTRLGVTASETHDGSLIASAPTGLARVKGRGSLMNRLEDAYKGEKISGRILKVEGKKKNNMHLLRAESHSR